MQISFRYDRILTATVLQAAWHETSLQKSTDKGKKRKERQTTIEQSRGENSKATNQSKEKEQSGTEKERNLE